MNGGVVPVPPFDFSVERIMWTRMSYTKFSFEVDWEISRFMTAPIVDIEPLNTVFEDLQEQRNDWKNVGYVLKSNDMKRELPVK